MRPFRFGIAGGRPSRQEWLDLARQTSDFGYSTLLLPDHFGPQMAPLPALLAAAMAAPTLRVGTIVLDNDFRHPAALAKEAATIDLLTDGRFELGIGAGWMEADYRQSGLPFDAPGVRVDRLVEALAIINAFFASEGPISYSGRFYKVDELPALPKPAQRPRPPILIGASRRRMLRLAAREADIVGLEDHQFAERATGAQTITPADCDAQVAIVREAAGERFAQIELNLFAARTIVTNNGAAEIDSLSSQLGLSPEAIRRSPSFLVGDVEELVDALVERREQLGISYVLVFAAALAAFAPVVKRLAGT